jgi:hypothetical protein
VCCEYASGKGKTSEVAQVRENKKNGIHTNHPRKIAIRIMIFLDSLQASTATNCVPHMLEIMQLQV